MANPNIQGTLDRILEDLKSGEKKRQLAAIDELGTIQYSSEAIIAQLERLILQGNETIRKVALPALRLKTSQSVASKLSGLSMQSRKLILGEVAGWQED